MNRYTFKAKRKDNGEWVCGTLEYNFLENRINETKEYFIKSYFKHEMFGKMKYQNCTYEIIPETLCQCTGLQDRDGKDMFENDIVELNNVEFRVDYSYGSFEFSHDCYIDKNCDDADYINPIDYKVDECKIIGNKFDKEED